MLDGLEKAVESYKKELEKILLILFKKSAIFKDVSFNNTKIEPTADNLTFSNIQ